ncbi:hypothetical protein SAMN05660649_01412 [Desulfotomaculum arcticum]|uniref:Uncharacterized protein n=1 Tax=Desulfotruncus arcticus DSM 17038 TaxID=1121424 RepID=A0A1I2RBW6_9FIRM|nr:hypothetical protein SAMN05660649_01412 [Desulfotomaculum arcticum] [Desulfotruncus arcticus DSM 17038]
MIFSLSGVKKRHTYSDRCIRRQILDNHIDLVTELSVETHVFVFLPPVFFIIYFIDFYYKCLHLLRFHMMGAINLPSITRKKRFRLPTWLLTVACVTGKIAIIFQNDDERE